MTTDEAVTLCQHYLSRRWPGEIALVGETDRLMRRLAELLLPSLQEVHQQLGLVQMAQRHPRHGAGWYLAQIRQELVRRRRRPAVG